MLIALNCTSSSPFISVDMQIHITYRAASHIYEVEENANVLALKAVISTNLDLPLENQKLLWKGRQLPDEETLAPTMGRMMLLASSSHAIDVMKGVVESTSAQRRSIPKVKVSQTRTTKEEMQYIFHRISPLPHLSGSDQSAAFLMRLASDASIKKLMIRHRLAVAHLTELDPRQFTTHDSKLLGLNKNHGQEILLRLRTDNLDGWRDYRTVRATLVHELVHNLVNDHPREFWDLFNQYSKEVAESETGQTLNQGDVYIPEEAKSCEHVAWHGGSHTLSGRQESSNVRESRARAAEARRCNK